MVRIMLESGASGLESNPAWVIVLCSWADNLPS